MKDLYGGCQGYCSNGTQCQRGGSKNYPFCWQHLGPRLQSGGQPIAQPTTQPKKGQVSKLIKAFEQKVIQPKIMPQIKKGVAKSKKTKKHDFDILVDELFLDFLKDTLAFQISPEDLCAIEEGKLYKCENVLEWVFQTNEGFCGIQGYYDNGILHITSFKAQPEGKGWGTKCIKLLSEILEEQNIDIMVEDELDEATKFWQKMSNFGYIL